MPRFSYVAIDVAGNRLNGVLEASSAVAARNELVGQRFDVLDVKERKSWTQFEVTRKKIKPADVMNFSRQLGAYLQAGIPILDALSALQTDTTNEDLKQVLVAIYDSL